jgi:hypothetical protein
MRIRRLKVRSAVDVLSEWRNCENHGFEGLARVSAQNRPQTERLVIVIDQARCH